MSWQRYAKHASPREREQLSNRPDLKPTDYIKCPQCQGRHVVYGLRNKTNGRTSDRIMFFNCRGKQFMAGLKGKALVEVSNLHMEVQF